MGTEHHNYPWDQTVVQGYSGGHSRFKPAQLADYLRGALRSLLHPATSLVYEILASAVSLGVLAAPYITWSSWTSGLLGLSNL